MRNIILKLTPIALSLATLPTHTWAAEQPIALPEVQVTSNQPDSSMQLNTTTTLSGFALKRSRANTLGDTINKIAGVHSSNFGPASSTPVIRSLSGNRVSIVNNNLDVSDLAGISGNLPISVEPMFSDSISVEKTGASILYGSHGIGGAVNIRDSRIPKELPSKPFGGSIEARAGYNTGNTQLFRLDGNVGEHWAWHIDGLRRQVGELHIPGNSKASLCNDENRIYTSGQYAGVDSRLAGLCQVNANITHETNPAYYPYLNINYKDDYEAIGSEAEYYSNKEYQNFTNKILSKANPANPDYIAGTTEKEISKRSPITDLTPIKKGRIPNSHQAQRQIALGSSYISEQGHIGLGFSRYLNTFGVPGFASISSLTQQTLLPVNIHNSQNRWAIDSQWRPENPIIHHINFQAAYTSNQNQELLGSTLSNSLNSRNLQARLELARQPFHGWQGNYGIDWKQRHITTTGPDRYLPNVNTQEYGLFALENYTWKQLTLEAGLRQGQMKHTLKDPNFKAANGTLYAQNRTFHINQKHIALQWQALPSLALRWQQSHGQRAPEVNELYAGNRHFAIWALEEGKGNLNKEKLHSNTLSAHWQHKGFQSQLSWYHNRFDNYTYLGQTGTSQNSLPRKQWRQAPQKIQGIELELGYQWRSQNGSRWYVHGFIDHVKSSPTNNTNNRQSYDGKYLPGLPTSRYGLNLDWQQQNWQLGTTLTRYQKQKYRGNYYTNSPEPALPAYTLWDAYLSYHQKWRGNNLYWTLDGRNLTNTQARPYNSPLKYLTPLSGRAISLGAKLDF